DVGNIFVIKVAGDLCLSFKQGDDPIVADRQVGLKDFKGDLTVNPKVAPIVNSPHATDADKRLDPVFVSENAANKVIGVYQREPVIVLRAHLLSAGVMSLADRAIFDLTLSWVIWVARMRLSFLPEGDLNKVRGRLSQRKQ